MKLKRHLGRIVFGAVLFAAGLALPVGEMFKIILYSAAYLLCAIDVLYKSGRNIVRGQVFDENFLMSVATLGAFAVRQYPEGVAVMLFYQVGEYFQQMAVNKSRKSIAALSAIRPDHANLKGADGQVTIVNPQQVRPGDILLVKPGERVALDSIILSGSSTLDTSALTGESLPRSVHPGDKILSGAINLNGVLEVRAEKSYSESTVSKILELVENAADKKAVTENFITQFARWYTPVVVLSAVLLAVLPPLLVAGATFDTWVYRALIFLVISCPCALVISVPLGFFGGIGGAARHGILIKGGNYLEALSRASIAVFDKTGTLTQGVFEVTHVQPAAGFSTDQLLELAAYAETNSTHPIAAALKKAYAPDIDRTRLGPVTELAGRGLQAEIDGTQVLAGNAKLLKEFNVAFEEANTQGTVVYLAQNGDYAGFISISDRIKPYAAQAVQDLKQLRLHTITLLSGDNLPTVKSVALELGIPDYHADLLPQEKVAELEKRLMQKKSGRTLLFVGDGINDAPVLARADIGMAMGGVGSDAAVEAADVVLMDDNPLKVPQAIELSRFTMKIIRQNIIFALGIKIVILALGATGEATMWEAVFADVGVSVAAILNAIRPLRFNPARKQKHS